MNRYANTNLEPVTKDTSVDISQKQEDSDSDNEKNKKVNVSNEDFSSSNANKAKTNHSSQYFNCYHKQCRTIMSDKK